MRLLGTCWAPSGHMLSTRLSACCALAGHLLGSAEPLLGTCRAHAGHLMGTCRALTCKPLAGVLAVHLLGTSWALLGACCAPAGRLLGTCWALAGVHSLARSRTGCTCGKPRVAGRLLGCLLGTCWAHAGHTFACLGTCWELAGFRVPFSFHFFQGPATPTSPRVDFHSGPSAPRISSRRLRRGVLQFTWTKDNLVVLARLGGTKGYANNHSGVLF